LTIGQGAEEFAMHSKGLEFPGYEPRSAKAHGLSYATSNIGGSHMYGYARQEISGFKEPREVDRFADTGKGDIVAYNQINKAREETLILCNFADSGITRDWLAALLKAATGIDSFGDPDYLDQVGERMVTLERCFNVREGFAREQDTLPRRMLEEPLKNAGPATGEVYRSFDQLLDEYYAAMGYDHQGRPTEAKLEELGLGWAAREIKTTT
jgi:aldehyde:ferredoxin oxidoreductase